MPKNILIFSDGTGMAGGITFDEDRTNVYKLYRATRCGPNSSIDPADQVGFYDPGLGSAADGGFRFGKAGRWLYNLASKATGLGITANIIDCYAALIRLYRDGDRIFLFGFSRGAYTVRCLAGVIARCGIPRHMPDGGPLPLDVAGSRKLAATAVKNIYQFTSSRPRHHKRSYRDFLLDTRDRIAARFRREHGCGDPKDPAKANIYPYFIGVFDTVAALGRPGAVLLFIVALALLVPLLSLGIQVVTTYARLPFLGWLAYFTFDHMFAALAAALALSGLIAFVRTYLKFDFQVPGYNLFWNLATLHLAPPKHVFTDYSLNENVGYAKHAISIDENRMDFKRVPWAPDASKATTRDAHGNLYFEQVWFAGVHADVGGGYVENESRLSDITLRWMLAAAAVVPDGIQHNANVLQLQPDPAGPQHDECKAGHWQHGVRELPWADEKRTVSRATMHKSVYTRFEANSVVLYDAEGPYRPPNLRCHVDFSPYYDGSPPPAGRECVADDIEYKWEHSPIGA